MDNVHDLKQTTDRIVKNTPNQQPISLSALGNDRANTQPTVSINATNGLSGVKVSDENHDRQVVRINPNPARRKIARRTIDDPSELNTVDPSEMSSIVPPKQAVNPVTPRDKAIGLLDEAVHRKQEEYREFVRSAEEADRENRQLVEDGLAEVGDEMQYMPDPLHVPMSEDDKVNTPSENYETTKDEEEEFFDESTANGGSFEDDFARPDINVNSKVYNAFDDDRNSRSIVDDYGIDPEDYADDPEFAAPQYTEGDMKDFYGDGKEDKVYEGDAPSDYFDDVKEEKYSDEDAGEVDTTSIEAENSKADEEVTFKPESKSVVSSALAENVTSSDFDVDEADFEDVTHDTEEQLTDDQITALEEAAERNLRSDILKKIVNAGKRVNTTQYKVSNKPVPLNVAMRNIQKVERTASWPMMFAGRPFKASALKGPEIAMLAELEDANTNFGINREQARIIFEHDASPYRPITLESWCKTIPLADLDNIYMALYIASMKNANYLPMVCPKNSCRNAYLSDDIPIESMINIEKDETKKRFEEIKNMELTEECSCAYESVITVINDNFAVGIKMPSVFNALYEYSTLNDEFIAKYASIIAVLQYIDYVYLIDPDTQQFQPIGWKTYHGDYTKTYKSKIATYAKIFKEFSSTDFALMTSLIDSMVMKEAGSKIITLQVPATKCPKCGTDIPESVMTARQMLFTQQRLVALATTPIEK